MAWSCWDCCDGKACGLPYLASVLRGVYREVAAQGWGEYRRHGERGLACPWCWRA